MTHIFQVWFKNRRAKCRQQQQQQQQQHNLGGGGGGSSSSNAKSSRAPGSSPSSKIKTSKTSPPPPAPSSTGSNSVSPPVNVVLKKEPSPVISSFQQLRVGGGGNATPIGGTSGGCNSAPSSVMIPSPPVTPGTSVGYQHDISYNGFGWGTAGTSNTSSPNCYTQNYSSYYGNMSVDYLAPSSTTVSHHQMGSTASHASASNLSQHYSSHNHVVAHGFNHHHHQMATYSGMGMSGHHQGFSSARHQDYNIDYQVAHDKYQMV
jgi:hypothetical protein